MPEERYKTIRGMVGSAETLILILLIVNIGGVVLGLAMAFNGNTVIGMPLFLFGLIGSIVTYVLRVFPEAVRVFLDIADDVRAIRDRQSRPEVAPDTQDS